MDTESRSHPASGQVDGSETAGNGTGVADMDPLCRFASGIAHDFNNLLTVVNGYSQLILSEKMDIVKCREYGGEILCAGNKAAEIVELILAYAGCQSMEGKSFNINEQLEKMKTILGIYVGESISLQFRLCEEPGTVSGDCVLFKRALMNIIMNAKEAMPDGGSLCLSTRVIPGNCPGSEFHLDTSGQIEINIRDTGCGMEKEVLDRAFDPYFSTKPRSNVPGQGLGLACTKGIVRQLGGSLHAESAVGAGTLIRIRLPIRGRT